MTKDAQLIATTRIAIEHSRHAMKLRLGAFKNDRYISEEKRLEHKMVAASLAQDSGKISECLQKISPQLGPKFLSAIPHDKNWDLWDSARGLYRCDTYSSFVIATSAAPRGNPATRSVLRYWVTDAGAGYGINFKRTAKGSADRKKIEVAINSLPKDFETHANLQKDFLESPVHLCGHIGSFFVGKWFGPEQIESLIPQLTHICEAVIPLLDPS